MLVRVTLTTHLEISSISPHLSVQLASTTSKPANDVCDGIIAMSQVLRLLWATFYCRLETQVRRFTHCNGCRCGCGLLLVDCGCVGCVGCVCNGCRCGCGCFGVACFGLFWGEMLFCFLVHHRLVSFWLVVVALVVFVTVVVVDVVGLVWNVLVCFGVKCCFAFWSITVWFVFGWLWLRWLCL